MKDAVRSGLFEAVSGRIHRLSGSGKGTGCEDLDLLCVSDASASVDDFLSGLLEVLCESSKLLHFSFDEGVAQSLHGTVDDKLIRLPRLEDPLAKRVERGLSAVARSRAKFDREHGVSFSHGEVGVGATVVEYKVHVFGFALVVIRIVDGCGDAESSIGPIFDKWWSWVCVPWSVTDDVLVGTHYYDQGSRQPNAMCERWR